DGKDTGRVTAAGGAVGIPIEGLEGGAHTIEIRQEGYETAKARVTLGSDPLPSVELTLTPLRRSWQVTSLPSGAEVRLDGKLLVGTTPLDVELTLLDEHEVVVSKPEYQSRSFKIPLGGELPGDPIVLAPLGKPGTLLVRASYPLSVRIGRRELARASNSPSVSLTAGTHQITLYAPKVFLNQTLRVEIREQSTTHLTAPALGRVSVRASPENCTLTISGIVSEAPPFNNKSIVVGSHAFVFEWPDGRRDTQQIAVKSDERAYVTGRAH
ncbi:MAG: PEGA domain-containing protein, partial [Acidobacteriota bacterium]